MNNALHRLTAKGHLVGRRAHDDDAAIHPMRPKCGSAACTTPYRLFFFSRLETHRLGFISKARRGYILVDIFIDWLSKHRVDAEV